VDAGDTGDYVTLSIAAKTFFLLTGTNRSMSVNEIRNEAKRTGWDIDEKAINKAGTFLVKLDVVDKE
jgi:hypothetical protein